MSIQEIMKDQRKKLGITQQDLAELAEIGITTIKQIEAGKGNPSLSTVEKMKDFFGLLLKIATFDTIGAVTVKEIKE